MAQSNDDSFREIQLSGKQLVFLFMAVVVILVGVFLEERDLRHAFGSTYEEYRRQVGMLVPRVGRGA